MFSFDVNSSEDVELGEGKHLRSIVNPYVNIYEGFNCHGTKATSDLKIIYSPRLAENCISAPIIINIISTFIVISLLKKRINSNSID